MARFGGSRTETRKGAQMSKTAKRQKEGGQGSEICPEADEDAVQAVVRMIAPMAECVRKPTESELAQLRPDNIDLLLRMNLAIMQHPFFTIQKTPQLKRREFDFGDVHITISPSSYGQATYWDLDILRYLCSQLNHMVENRKEHSRQLTVVAHKVLKFAGRTTGKAGYQALIDALRRLAGTRVETNIKAGGKFHINSFSWIESYDLLGEEDDEGRMTRLTGISLKLSEWVYDAIATDRAVLSFAPEYFTLTSGLERRLYDIARKFCGASPFWPISLVNLHAKIGTTQPLKRLRMELQKIIDADPLPEYRLQFVNLPKAEAGKPAPRINLERLQLRFYRKSPGAKALADQSIDTTNVIEGSFKVVEPTSIFPETGTIRYSDWKGLALDNLPRPTPDLDSVADRFRIWAKEKNIALDGKTIEKTFVAFCKKWRLDSH
jgi:hypothetical protein